MQKAMFRGGNGVSLLDAPSTVRKTPPEESSKFLSQDYGVHITDQAHGQALRVPQTAPTATTTLCESERAAQTQNRARVVSLAQAIQRG